MGIVFLEQRTIFPKNTPLSPLGFELFKLSKTKEEKYTFAHQLAIYTSFKFLKLPAKRTFACENFVSLLQILQMNINAPFHLDLDDKKKYSR